MGGVAVAAHADLARNAKACHMNGMANAVARARNIHAVLAGHRLQINVIIGGHIVHIQQVVVQIAYAALGAHARQANGFKGKVGHHSVDVVGQGLVNLNENFFTGFHAALDEVGLQNFAGQGFSHGAFLLFSSVSVVKTNAKMPYHLGMVQKNRIVNSLSDSRISRFFALVKLRFSMVIFHFGMPLRGGKMAQKKSIHTEFFCENALGGQNAVGSGKRKEKAYAKNRAVGSSRISGSATQ